MRRETLHDLFIGTEAERAGGTFPEASFYYATDSGALYSRSGGAWIRTDGGGATFLSSDGLDFVIEDTQRFILISAVCIANMPPSPFVGAVYDVTALIDNIEIGGNAKTINGAASIIINTNESLTLRYSGTEWRII